ncbi:MAG: hypothetical protein C0447_18380 [Methylobacterium sp.]|uniref:hypothetical protein n=1 Tax=Bosea sp. (in: a-proteobacteria) TaxID=1871050 RepID=UPI001D401CB3|nr:hypothetical protein [Bosea sp. (in: a-proteobacteria)]MBA4271356.1 hypothetical protein [Methylobacterium sp.]WRH60409.1 MAG: hypothetical protein RSE11_11755 [Bosea sp. (in: a-proteobacteria)]
MVAQPVSLTRRRRDPLDLARLSRAGARAWYEAPAYAELAAIADFNADRYAITTVPLASIAGASAAALRVKRAASFAELIAFTCSSGSARSYLDAQGLLRADLAADQPRFDWTNGRRQLALNGASANLLLNSAAPASQSVAVTAQSYALSFNGTGSIALSGASSAGPLAGTGAASRVSLVFTPAAGTLTLTMSGDVRLAQLEANSFASPSIATAGAAVSRAAESAEFSPVLEALLQRSAATLVVRGQRLERNAARIVGVNGASSLLRAQSNRLSVLMDGSAQLATAAGADLRTGSYAAACAFDATGRSVVRNGVAVVTDSGTPPTSRSAVYLGRDGAGTVVAYGDGWYDHVMVAGERLTDWRLLNFSFVS